MAVLLKDGSKMDCRNILYRVLPHAMIPAKINQELVSPVVLLFVLVTLAASKCCSIPSTSAFTQSIVAFIRNSFKGYTDCFDRTYSP